MKLALKFLLVLALLTALAPVAALADTYDTATLVAITPPSKEDVQILYDNHIDITGLRDGVYRALLTDDQFQLLKAQGFGIQILYTEMQEDRARWAEASASYALATSYYTPSKFNTTNPAAGTVMEHLLQQYNAHPDITRLYNLGASQDGAYDIIAMKVSKNPDVVEAEPKIRLYANIHGDEQGGVMVTCDVLDTILAGYTAVPQDATAKKLVDETEMWFIPIGNPYGNAHFTRYNSRTIDLNRNFWGPAGSDAPPAWSEKETQVIRDLTEAVTADHSKKRFAVSISFHEGDIVFNSVWNYTTSQPSDEPIFWTSRTGGTGCTGQTIPNCPTLAPNGLAQAYKDGCSMPGFWYTEGYDWYGTKGDTNDWAYGYWGDLDTTIELNTTKTPAASQIPTYTAQHRQAVLNYMMKVFQGIHGAMTDQSTGAPLDGTVTVTATASSSIPVPHVYQAVYTDPVAGDFHRVLQPGTYTVVCSAPGYANATITGVVVNADAKTVTDCVMNKTALAYASSVRTDSCSSGGAYSGDGILDAGEDAVVQATVNNSGTVAATSVQGALTTAAPGVTIAQGTAAFPDVSASGNGTSTSPHFRFNVDASVACGTVIPFNIHMTSAQGAWDSGFTATVGQVSTPAPQTLLSESFDGSTFPPSGWAQADVSGAAGNWARITTPTHPAGISPHSGAGSAFFNSFTASSGSSTRLYRMAGSAIPGSAASAALNFWMYHDTTNAINDRVQIQVSTNGLTWTNVGAAVARYDGSVGWKQHTIALDSYIGQSSVEIGFLGLSAKSSSDCHIDDVQVTYTLPSTCTMHTCSASQSADLSATAAAPPSTATNATISYALGVTNNGPNAASSVQLQTSTPAQTTFVSMSAPTGWSCSTPAIGATGSVSCTAATLASNASASLSMVVKLGWCVGNGTAITASATTSSASSDVNLANNVATASTSAIDNGSCSDGNACTQSDSCQGGACVGASPVNCAASDQCHVAGTCDPQTGTCSNPIAANGTACSDGNACTQSDSCQGGACVGSSPVTCAVSDQCHVAGICDPQSGVCSNPIAANGTACNDGNACTQSDSCQAGACVGSNAVTCSAADQCHVAGTCDPQSGACSNPAAANGTACHDGNACTQTDTCQGGVCAGGNPVICAASDQCHVAGSCNPFTGACTNPIAANGTACNDGNVCTEADGCTNGACAGTAIAAPGEVSNAAFLTKTSVGWDAAASGSPAPTYDIARGTLGQWPAGTGGSDVCEASQQAPTTITAGEVPDADSGFWYLIRVHTTCGVGTYGAASDGTARSVSTCP